MKFEYDLSGVNEIFKKTDTFKIFKPHQQIRLTSPAYKNRPFSTVTIPGYLTVEYLDETSNEATYKTITEGTNDGPTFSIVPLTDDDVVMSDVLQEPGGSSEDFNPTIFHMMQINLFGSEENQIDKPFTVRVSYHVVRLDPIESRSTGDFTEEYDGTGPRYSPALMQKLLSRMDRLEEKANTAVSLFGTDHSTDEILDEDPTGAAPENYVQYERHSVNTQAGINLIQPSKGGFYPNNLRVFVYSPKNFTLTYATRSDVRNKLFIYSDVDIVEDSTTHVSTEHRVIMTDLMINQLLKIDPSDPQDSGIAITGRVVDLMNLESYELAYGVDYTIDSIDTARTARSTSTYGVYQNIRFITPRIGEVMICYQAFGGMVASEDIRSLHQHIVNTRTILQNTDLLTTSNLEKQPFIVELNKRMRRMEEYHNHFSQVEHRISIGHPGMHWFNIAAIYDVDWGTLIHDINDIGQFKIQSALRKWTYEFIVDVDLTRPAGDILHLKTLGTNQWAANDPQNYNKVLFRDNLAVRLCWVDNGNNSGVVLQIGWDFNGYRSNRYPIDTDTIVVTNKSGSASLWTLLHDPTQLNHQAKGIISVFDHHKFVVTDDDYFEYGKAYYLYRDSFIYVRTADKFIQEGKRYWSYRDVPGGTSGYSEVTAATNINFVPGASTDAFIPTGETLVNLFERVLYGHYPVQAEIPDSKRGQPMETASWMDIDGEIITSDYYEVVDSSYDDDTFTMPNTSITWRAGENGSNSCVKLIEPEDGIIAWLGNVNLSKYAPNFGNCAGCIDVVNDRNDHDPNKTHVGEPSTYSTQLIFSYDMHRYLNLETMRSIDITLFDRRDGKYVTTRGILDFVKDGDGFASTCELMFNYEDMCCMSLKLYKDTERNNQYQYETLIPENERDIEQHETHDIANGVGLIFMDINVYMGSMSRINDRFDLRQVKLHF